MAFVAFSLEEVLPHARPMILLDKIVDWNSVGLTAAVTIGPAQIVRDENGVPAHVAIEYMAQACGAYVGVEALQSGCAPQIGMLLGTRNFRATRHWFVDEQRILVTVVVTFREDEMGVFDCSVTDADNGETLATAQLTVYQPATKV